VKQLWITGDGEEIEIDSRILEEMDDAQDEYASRLQEALEEEQDDWMFADGD
jgi:hypothetical protein